MRANGASFEEKTAWMRERQSAPSPALPSAQGSFSEHHYSVAEVSAMWSLSPDAARKIFQDEPGVLVLGALNPSHKRRYTTLRIPESVVQRVHRRLTNT